MARNKYMESRDAANTRRLLEAQRNEAFTRQKQNPAFWNDVPGLPSAQAPAQTQGFKNPESPSVLAQMGQQPAPVQTQGFMNPKSQGLAGMGSDPRQAQLAGLMTQSDYTVNRGANGDTQLLGVQGYTPAYQQANTLRSQLASERFSGYRGENGTGPLALSGAGVDRANAQYLADINAMEERDMAVQGEKLKLLGAERNLNAPASEDPSITVERMKQIGAITSSPAFMAADKAGQDAMLAPFQTGGTSKSFSMQPGKAQQAAPQGGARSFDKGGNLLREYGPTGERLSNWPTAPAKTDTAAPTASLEASPVTPPSVKTPPSTTPSSPQRQQGVPGLGYGKGEAWEKSPLRALYNRFMSGKTKAREMGYR